MLVTGRGNFSPATIELGFELPAADIADGYVSKIGFEPLEARIEAADGFFLEVNAVIRQPAFRQRAESELAGSLGLVQTGDFVAEIIEPAVGEGSVVGLERPSDLLARPFEQGIVCSR
ncbi:MAG TPA: hypothetical protein VK742_15715 [Candidatus Sulfotelmatobacter sp.]|nr:hypothetical protein [Candidatus Sulfotelmatobacter sp.]